MEPKSRSLAQCTKPSRDRTTHLYWGMSLGSAPQAQRGLSSVKQSLKILPSPVPFLRFSPKLISVMLLYRETHLTRIEQ
jgi:hypothetical protein